MHPSTLLLISLLLANPTPVTKSVAPDKGPIQPILIVFESFFAQPIEESANKTTAAPKTKRLDFISFPPNFNNH